MCAGRGARPHCSSTDAQRRRSARSFATPRNSSAIDGDAEGDEAARLFQREARAFEQPQAGEGGAERIAEFLRLRPAGRVDQSRIGDKERARETTRHKRADALADCARYRVSPPPRAKSPNGSMPKAIRVAAGSPPRARKTSASARRELAVVGQVDLDRHFGVEHDARQKRVERRIAGEAATVGADAAGENDLQPVRAIAEIVERLRVGGGRIGLVDTLEDGPAALRAGDRRGPGGGGVERLDRNAVVGLARERRRALALQDGFDPAPPVCVAGGRKSIEIGEGGVGHRSVCEGFLAFSHLCRKPPSEKPADSR